MLRTLIAPNPSPMTLDGTRTYIIGRRQTAIIDPGPAIASHLNAIIDAVDDGASVTVLLTHQHPDHDEAMGPLMERLKRSESRTPTASPAPTPTDAGELLVLPTPGHTPDHVSYWLPAQGWLFCGDLMMGGHNTALVAPPEGHLGDYLDSLERIRTLSPTTIYPAHGEPFTEPERAVEEYLRHRRDRLQQVVEGLADGPLDPEQLCARVYGAEVPAALMPYARAAIDAYLEHLERAGRVRRQGAAWQRR